MARALALLLGLFPALSVAEEPPYAHLFLRNILALRDRVVREVVRLEVERPASGSVGKALRFDGGGVHLGGGRVLTSAFLVEGATRIRAWLPGGGEVSARLLRHSLPLGLALVDVGAAEGMASAAIAGEERSRPGAVVYLLLNPTTSNAQLRVGWIVESRAQAFYARTTFFARNGHPLYDEWGKVMGLGMIPAADGVTTLVVPAWAIRKFLEEQAPSR
jgi:hypothetical protein